VARTEKQYSRLSELEREFRSLVRDEFLSETEGHISAFLARWNAAKSTKVDRLNRLARQIESLRSKLNESTPWPTGAVVSKFISEYDNLGTHQSPHVRVDMAKRAIGDLDAISAPDLLD
jgi:hypothetical protein